MNAMPAIPPSSTGPEPTAPAESSHARMGAPVLLARSGQSAAEVRAAARVGPGIDWAMVGVVGPDGRLLGTLTPGQLLGLPDAACIDDAMRRDPPAVPPSLDQEHAANVALDRGATALAVVDAQQRLIGAVGPADLMDVLRREHVEDLHRLAGITREADGARHALEDPPLRRVRHRLPWLLVGLVGSALATGVVASFESALAAKPALAFFVPGLVYLADAIGTQSEAVAVRGLSLSRAGLPRLLGGEFRTGALIGLVLALLAFPLVWAGFGDMRLAAAVAAALACASVVATMLGLLLPWALARVGADPAYGSGPLATIIQDVLSLVIYFAFVSWVVL
jgi:magnesium transporter